MITLSILIILLTIFLWYKHYKNCKTNNINLSPFDGDPTPFTIALVITTIISITIVIGLILTFLP